jgi:hypothetical protein
MGKILLHKNIKNIVITRNYVLEVRRYYSLVLLSQVPSSNTATQYCRYLCIFILLVPYDHQTFKTVFKGHS